MPVWPCRSAQMQLMRGWCVLHHGQVKRLKVQIARVIWNFCCVHSVAPCLFVLLTLYATHIQPMRGRCVLHTIPSPKVKGQGHTGCSEFLPCLLHVSVPILHICFICYTNTMHDGMMCHTSFPGQKVKGQGHTGGSKFLLCLLHGSAYFYNSFHLWHKYNLWCDLPYTISRSAGWMSRCREFFLAFLPCFLNCSVSVWQICFICGTNTTHEGQCVIHHYQVKKGQSHIRRSYLKCWPLAADGWYGF